MDDIRRKIVLCVQEVCSPERETAIKIMKYNVMLEIL